MVRKVRTVIDLSDPVGNLDPGDHSLKEALCYVGW